MARESFFGFVLLFFIILCACVSADAVIDECNSHRETANCVIAYALRESNASICGYLENGFDRGACYSELAPVLGDPFICLEAGELFRDQCLKEIAVATLNLSVCNISGKPYETCVARTRSQYYQKAIQLGTSSHCEDKFNSPECVGPQIRQQAIDYCGLADPTDGEVKRSCYFQCAQNLRYGPFCQYTGQYEEECRFKVARILKNYSVCDNLTFMGKDECLEELSSWADPNDKKACRLIENFENKENCLCNDNQFLYMGVCIPNTVKENLSEVIIGLSILAFICIVLIVFKLWVWKHLPRWVKGGMIGIVIFMFLFVINMLIMDLEPFGLEYICIYFFFNFFLLSFKVLESVCGRGTCFYGVLLMLFYVVLQGFVVGALFGWLTSKIKKFSSGKKGFLVLFIFLGIVYFIVFPTGLGIGMLLVRIFPLLLGLTHLSLFVPICFTAYVLLVILILDKYSKRKLLMLIAILSIHLLVIIIPFPVCNSSGRFSDTTQSCTCLGLSKYSMVIDASWTQCVGIPINYGQTNKALLRQESNIPIDTCGNSICEEYELIATCQEDCNDLETHTYQICRNTRNKWGGITGISIYGTNISLPGETRIISNISNNNETNKLDVTTETYICYNITEVHEPIFGISIKSGAGHFPACRHLVHKYYVDGVSYDCEEEMGTYRGNIMYYPYDEERFELFRRVILSKYVEKYSEEYFSCEDNAFCHIKTALENNDFNHCSKLAADSAALCVNRFAEAHENRSYCDNLNGSYRDHCYYGFDQPLIRRAELRKNESYCNQVYVPWSRAKCHISLGNNVSINVTTCENLSEKTELECIMYLAKSSNNHTYCNQTSELKGPCFLYFAKMLNQSDLCYKAEGTMGRCLNQFYFKSVDPLICGELENNYYTYACWIQAAIQTNDSAYCHNVFGFRESMVVSQPVLPYERHACLEIMAQQLEDYNLCFEESHNTDNCLHSVLVQSYDDPELCSLISDRLTKKHCYFDFAHKLKDNSLCEKADRPPGCYNCGWREQPEGCSRV